MSIEGGVIAVIIGRAGSKGLPGKNRLDFNNKPIVWFSIADALHAKTVDRVVVSTDDEEIKSTARENKKVTVVDRPSELATDTATVDAAVRHAVETIDAQNEIVVILYANVPLRPDGLIDRAVHMLVKTGADSVQSYTDVGTHHPYWMVTLDDDDRVVPHLKNTVYRRQDLPKLLIPNGGVIAVTRKSLFTVIEGEPHAFLGTDRRGIETDEGTIIDIDAESDMVITDWHYGLRICDVVAMLRKEKRTR